MYFLKKNFSSNLKDRGKIVAIIFLILIVVNIFMPRIEGLDGDDPGGDHSGGDDSGSSNSFPSDGSGVDMYKVPGSNNPNFRNDVQKPLNEKDGDFSPNINSAADACRAIRPKSRNAPAISDSMDSIASII